MSANVVTITDQSKLISNISYVKDSLEIPPSQPSQDPTVEVASSTPTETVFKITLEAGRENSTPIAADFNNACGGQDHEYAPSGGEGGTPRQLNFFFSVHLEFTLPNQQPKKVLINLGQGHFFDTNNWWVGGKSVTKAEQPLLIAEAGGQVVTLLMSGNEDSFTFKFVEQHARFPIQHVFVLMLENHSFDNMFALSGIPNLNVATTSDSNSYGNNKPFFVGPGAPPSMPTDPGHEFPDVVEQLCGQGKTFPPGGPYPPINMSGFVANYATTTSEGPVPPDKDWGDIMLCFDTKKDLPVLYQLATEYAVCDQWFSSLPGPTWPNRYFVHGASSNGLATSPTKEEMGKWEAGPFKFTYPRGSIYDSMRAVGIPYAFYQDHTGSDFGILPQVASINNISISDVESLETLVTELQGPDDYPYAYTFIEPNYGDLITGTYEDGTSQHPMDSIAGGEELISTVYEAIRGSKAWKSSLLIITYDEHGGFYDHFIPGAVAAPHDGSSTTLNTFDFPFNQLGVRVPAVIVSPFIAKGTVDPTVYDHSSVLATVEELFGLNALTLRDSFALNLLHLISDTFREDCPTTLVRPAPVPKRLEMTASHRMVREQQPIPERGNLHGFIGVAAKAELEMSLGTPAEREAIVAKVNALKTRGDARAYIESVLARVQAEKAARVKT